MRHRHVELAQEMYTKARARLMTIDPDSISPRDLVALSAHAVSMERQARGEPERISEARLIDHTPTPTISGERILGLLRRHPEIAEFADHVADAMAADDAALDAEESDDADGV